jgi:hypothetical protein
MNTLQKALHEDFQTHILIATGVLAEAVRRFAATRTKDALQAVRLAAGLLAGTVHDWRMFGFDAQDAVADQPESVRTLVSSTLTMFGETAAADSGASATV